MDLKSEKVKVENIIKERNIRTLYQPLISLEDGGILGYEALTRGPEGSDLEDPGNLFDAARRHNLLWEMDFICRVKAIESFPRNLDEYKLFLNVDPEILLSGSHTSGSTRQFLSRMELNANNIIFEITEKTALEDFSSFKNTLDHYSNQGFQIAIDDSGTEYSGLSLLSRAYPHYLKLDMDLIRDIDRDGFKRDLIRSIKGFAGSADIKLIAEGIETRAELETLIDLDVDYGQGYFFRRPQEEAIPLPPNKVEIIRENYRKKKLRPIESGREFYLGKVALPDPPVDIKTGIEEIKQIFINNPKRQVLVVIDEQEFPLGIIERDCLERISGPSEGKDLLCPAVINSSPPCLDYFSPINEVTPKIEETGDISGYILITENNRYYGITTFREVRKKAEAWEIKRQYRINSLTFLPGKKLVDSKVSQYLKEGKKFFVISFFLEGFSELCPFEGGKAREQVLLYTADLLKEIFAKRFSARYFLGQAGREELLLITLDDLVMDVAGEIIKEFEKGKAELLKEAEHIQQGNFLSLKVAGLEAGGEKKDLLSIYQELEKIKADCRKRTGSNFLTTQK